jgi:hypothetical protein
MPRWNRELLCGSERRGIRRRLDPRLRLEHPKEIDGDEGEDAGEQHDGRHQHRGRAPLVPRPSVPFVHAHHLRGVSLIRPPDA